MLKDNTGKIKPFNQFLNDIQSTFKNYNELYLESEYQFSVGSSLMNVKWNEFDKNGDRYNIQYRTAGDEKVRESHAKLDLTTLPADSPFWDSYFPPNGWRCRCTASEVLKNKYPISDVSQAIAEGEKATIQIGKDGKNRLEIFRFNPGKQKVIFPPSHPYRKLQGVDGVIELINSQTLSYNEIKRYPNNGTISIHNTVDQNSSDFQRVYNCCDYFAKKGHTTTILPRFNSTEKSDEYKIIFSDLKGTKYEGKCPDFKVDNTFYEHEGFETGNIKRAFKNMLNRGLSQSNNIIIDDCGATERYMIHNINTRVIIDKQEINEVWVLKDKQLKKIYPKNTKTS